MAAWVMTPFKNFGFLLNEKSDFVGKHVHNWGRCQKVLLVSVPISDIKTQSSS